MTVLLTNARLADGSITSARLADGVIDELGPSLVPQPDDEVVDLDGRLLLAAPAEPHAHLDKALTADLVPNPAGDLLGAIDAWRAHRATLTVDDIADRASRAVELGISNGVTAFRTHIDVEEGYGTVGLEALLRVKAEKADRASVQIVGLVACPLSGRAGAGNRAVLTDALAAGLDIVGGVPHLDDDPAFCTRHLLEQAAEHGRPLDLHTDENLDPASRDLETLADLVLASGFDHGVTASHCVSLSMQDAATQQRIAEKVSAAGISVVALPQTNLFLQARGEATAPPRGLTAIAALETAGVNVAGGADNLQDPFCTVGRGDPLETAALLVMAGHLRPELAYEYVSRRARVAMGLPSGDVRAGSPAELVALRAASVREAVALAPPDRVVFHQGRLVSGG